MAKVSKSLVFGVVVFLLSQGTLHAQFNPLFQHRDIIDKEFHYSEVRSAIKPTVIGQPHIGKITFESDPVGEDLYRFEYKPGKIEANTKGVIEYWTRDAETGELQPEYTTFTFRITRSLVLPRDDRAFINVNESISNFDVLENDTRTDGPLVISNISYSENGLASINGDKIDFTPNTDFVGDAFIYYTAEDVKGKQGTGILKIKVTDPNSIPTFEEIDLISYGGVPVEIDLPSEGFELSGNISNGSIAVEGGICQYVPYANLSSSESFTLISGDLTRLVNVKVVEKERPNSWVNDDLIYTSQGTFVKFDVEKNDLKQNQTLTDYSSDLTAEAQQGVFSYTPPSYFTGSKTFDYTVYNGFDSETGKIHLKVSNFFPQTQYNYNFRSLRNSALIIEYLIPINDFSFELISAPSNGSVMINSGEVVMDLGCTEIAGKNLVIYEPDFTFTGNDAFTLRYCVDEHCEDVEIGVEVVASELDDCQCYTGCVWAGDANNDGLVNVTDLLPLAYSVGKSGALSEWNGGSGWIGRKTDDWLFESTQGVNAKYADSDGNGLIDELDFDAILDNYDRNHALVPPQLLSNKSYPFSLISEQDTVYIGDLLEFEIGVGDDFYPALDVHGLAFSLGLPPSLVDSSSLTLEYYNDSWLAIDEAIYSISKQISDGWIETAVARMGQHPQSGAGELGKLSFIVEEDLVGGFRASNGIVPLTVSIKNGQVLSGDGQMGSVAGASKTVYVNLNDEQSSKEENSSLLVYPNPSVGHVNVHMNGGHEILSYQVYDLLGRQTKSARNLADRSVQISLDGMNIGQYVLVAQTTFGPKTARFEVIK